MDNLKPSTQDVEVLLHFYKPPRDGSAPTFTVTDPSGGGVRNYGHDQQKVLVHDMRGSENPFNLAVHSFTPVSDISTKGIDFNRPQDIKNQYDAVVEQTIHRQIPEAQKIVIFDSTIRKATPGNSQCGPVWKVHIDQSPAGACQRIERHLSHVDAQKVMNGTLRARIINMWRPLVGPVEDHPLAVAESDSIDEQDLVRVKHIYPDKIGETLAVRHNPRQRFWYWSRMMPEEALLFVCYDSKISSASGLRIRCAHASFAYEENPLLERCERQSIETRCIVLG